MFAFIMFVPQALRCWRLRHNPTALEGVSRAGMVMLLVNAVLWAVYGLGVGAIWSAVPSFFNAPLALFVLARLTRADRPGSGDTPRRTPPQSVIVETSSLPYEGAVVDPGPPRRATALCP